MNTKSPVPVIDDGHVRIEVTLQFNDPVDVTDFANTLTGLLREYQASLKRSGSEASGHETKLVITDIRKGSVILDLVPWLMPIVAEWEKIKPAVDMVVDMAKAFDALKVIGGRLPDATSSRLKSLQDTVRAVANDTNGSVKIAARHKEKGVLQEIFLSKEDAKTIDQNVVAQRKEIEAPTSVDYPGVIMRLHQSSIADASVGKRTTEKGIVERYDDRPRPLVYASDAAANRIKSVIAVEGQNPYKKLFVVDLDVEMVAGTAKAYRIIEVKDVIDDDGA